MNRNILIAAVIVVLAAFGYYQFSVVPAQRAAEEAAAEAKAAADAKAAEEAAAAEAKAAEEAATKAAEEAAAAADAATEAAGAAADAVAVAGEQIWDATKLTADEITQRIANAPISQSVKDTLTATYNSVKDNPSAVQTVLDQLKQAMGL